MQMLDPSTTAVTTAFAQDDRVEGRTYKMLNNSLNHFVQSLSAVEARCFRYGFK